MSRHPQILVGLSADFVARVAKMPLRPLSHVLEGGVYLICKRVLADEPYYLRVWAQMVGNKRRVFELQIPHSAVEFLWLSVPKKKLGFGALLKAR